MARQKHAAPSSWRDCAKRDGAIRGPRGLLALLAPELLIRRQDVRRHGAGHAARPWAAGAPNTGGALCASELERVALQPLVPQTLSPSTRSEAGASIAADRNRARRTWKKPRRKQEHGPAWRRPPACVLLGQGRGPALYQAQISRNNRDGGCRLQRGSWVLCNRARRSCPRARSPSLAARSARLPDP